MSEIVDAFTKLNSIANWDGDDTYFAFAAGWQAAVQALKGKVEYVPDDYGEHCPLCGGRKDGHEQAFGASSGHTDACWFKERKEQDEQET